MNMRKTGLLLTGGLAVMLVVFIVAYGILLATETMPVHIEIKEPPTADQQHGNIALPSVVERVDPEYLLSEHLQHEGCAAAVVCLCGYDANGEREHRQQRRRV